MAAVSLFWDTNKADVTSCENTLLLKSWLKTITHTQEPMTLVMDSWHTSIQNGFGNSVDLRKSYGGRFLNGFLKRVRSIGKSGFRFSKSKSWFPNRTQNPRTDFTSEKSVLRVDFNSEIQIRISWISFLPFVPWACKTAVLKDSFSNPFSDFPIER